MSSSNSTALIERTSLNVYERTSLIVRDNSVNVGWHVRPGANNRPLIPPRFVEIAQADPVLHFALLDGECNSHEEHPKFTVELIV